PEIVQDQVRRGHVVGGHTWDHIGLAGMSDSTFSSQVDRTDDLLGRLTGQPVRCVRPPYGSYDAAAVTRLGARGIATAMWSVDPRDWSRPGTGTIVNRVLSAVGPGSIVILHDGGGDRSQTIAALPSIIEGIRARGYRLVPICGTPPRPPPPPPVRD